MHVTAAKSSPNRRLSIASPPSDRPSFLRNSFSRLGSAEVVGSGLWTVAYVDAHFSHLEEELSRIRVQFGLARVLVDLRQADVQPTETADRISYWTQRIYRPEDRVAIIHDSPLLQEQMRERVVTVFDVFGSGVAARLWLYQDWKGEHR